MKISSIESDEGNRLRELTPAIGILLTIPNLVLMARNIKTWFDGNHIQPMADGLYVWSGAHLALTGRLDILFDPLKFSRWFALNFGGDLHVWGYPPSYLLLALPFGFLSPPAAVICFDLLSILCLVLALRGSGFGWKICLAVALSPAALISLNVSQNGALIASLLISGLWLADRRPWLAGVLIGLVTIKPQLGVLIPVYLLAQGNWRSITSAFITSLTLALVSASVFHPQSWYMFVGKVMPFMQYFLAQLTRGTHLGPRAMIMSVFSFSRQIGLGVTASMAIQMIAMLGAILTAWIIGRNKAFTTQEKLTWILLLGVLATPYIWCYDMISASLAVAILIQSGMKRGFVKGELIALISLWMTPGLAVNAAFLGWPTFAPLLIAVTLLYAWRHFRIERRATFYPNDSRKMPLLHN